MLVQLAVCEWTFSLWISSAQCCDSTACEQVGTCDDFFIALCLRDPGHIVLDRESCPIFIAGDGRDIIGRQLSPANIVTSNVRKKHLARLLLTLTFSCIIISEQLAPAGMTSISTAYRVRDYMKNYRTVEFVYGTIYVYREVFKSTLGC